MEMPGRFMVEGGLWLGWKAVWNAKGWGRNGSPDTWYFCLAWMGHGVQTWMSDPLGLGRIDSIDSIDSSAVARGILLPGICFACRGFPAGSCWPGMIMEEARQPPLCSRRGVMRWWSKAVGTLESLG